MPELTVDAVLVVINGLFSLSELAIVSSRKARLRIMADAGRPRASTALAQVARIAARTRKRRHRRSRNA